MQRVMEGKGRKEKNLLGGVSKSEFDHRVEVVHEILHGLQLYGGAQEDQEDAIYESLPERNCPDEAFPDGFFVTAHEEVGIWWGSFCSHSFASMLKKMLAHE